MKQNKFPPVYNGGRLFFASGIKLGQKWWQTLLEREISCSQWEGPSMHPTCLAFSNWGVRGFFFIFPWFPNVFSLSSLQVPNGFPLGSQYVPQFSNVLPNVFSIAPHFYRICFGRCLHPFTSVGGPKGMNIIFQNKTFYFGETSIVSFFEWWANQIGSLPKPKKEKLNLGGTWSN